MALANRICRSTCRWRSAWRCRTDGSRSRDSSRSVDQISAARMATKRSSRRYALRLLAHGPTHSRATPRSCAAGDGRLNRNADSRRGHTRRSALARPAADDAVGQFARKFHFRPGDDCANRVRRALACNAFGASGRLPAMVLVRTARARRRLPEPVRTGNDSSDVPHGCLGCSPDDPWPSGARRILPMSARSKSSCSARLASLFSAA